MSESAEDPYQKAVESGVKVVESHPKLVQIDRDVPAGQKEILENKASEARSLLTYFLLDDNSVLQTVSKGGNQHVYRISKVPLSPEARIAVQLIMGSDPKREALSLLRVLKVPGWEADRPATVLFETPDQYEVAKSFADAALPKED